MADPSPSLDRRPSRRKTRTLSLGRWGTPADRGDRDGDHGDDRDDARRVAGGPSLNAYAAARVGAVGKGEVREEGRGERGGGGREGS